MGLAWRRDSLLSYGSLNACQSSHRHEPYDPLDGIIGCPGLRLQAATEFPQRQPTELPVGIPFWIVRSGPWGPGGRNGSANLTGEILFAKPFTASDLFTSYFIPRPHMGGSLNFDWQDELRLCGPDLDHRRDTDVFVEGSLGGAVHNGKDHLLPDRQPWAARRCFVNRARWACGCRPIGACMATIEHLSNAGTCSDENRGLTNVGARVGYSF